jgi:acylphosphatase
VAAVVGMLEYCPGGPPRARVDDVAIEYEPPEGIEGFEIRR